nr:hypothetical protein [Tanacetum cinerariifolium]
MMHCSQLLRAGKDGDEDDDEDDDNDDEEEEPAKDDEENKETGKGGEEVRKSGSESEEEKETSEEDEGSFDPIPRTPEDSEKESDDEEEEPAKDDEENKETVTQSVEDTHVILTPVNPDDPQESSSMSSFVSSMLNPLSDEGVESIFTTTSSQIVSLEPPTPIMTPSTFATITTSGEAPIPPPIIPSIILENLPTSSMLNPLSDEGVESIFTTTSSQIVSLEPPTPIMTPSTIATITTSGEAPIPPPTIPSIILENLPTFNSAFRFEERLRLLETSFYEYTQANQTDQLQDSLQRENDEFLRNIDENMKNVLKGLVKTQVKEQVSRILPRVEESVNATLEAEVLTRSSHSSRTSYAVAADSSEMELKKSLLKRWKEISLSNDPKNNETFIRH